MTFDEIADEVMIEAQGAPLAMIRRAVLQSARELCSDADAWIHDQGPIVVAAKTAYPQLNPPSGGEALRIRKLFDGERELTPGFDYEQPQDDKVKILARLENGSLTGELACRPRRNAQRLPDTLERWADALADGARYRLLRQPGVEWSQPNLATYYERRFEYAKTEAMKRGQFGHAKGTRTVRMRRFI